MKDTYKIIRTLQISPSAFCSKICNMPLKIVAKSLHKHNSLKNPTYNNSYKDEIKVKHVYNLPNYLYLKSQAPLISNVYKNIKKHDFDLLGSNPTHSAYSTEKSAADFISQNINSANRPIAQKAAEMLSPDYKLLDFECDFKTGYRWDVSAPAASLSYGNGNDVKVAWEFARMQHLPLTAYAYCLAMHNEIKYSPEEILAEFCNQVINFYIANPPEFGIQWKCAMDVSIRLVNILTAVSFFMQAGAEFGSEFRIMLKNMTTDHINFVLNNPEFSGGIRGNHYFTNIAGLLISCLMLQDNPDFRETLFMSMNEFACEIMFQFGKDGGNFEASLPYHYLCTEIIGYVLAALQSQPMEAIYTIFTKCPSRHFKLKQFEATFSDKLCEKLQSVFEFSNTFLDKSGTYNIGDNDSGKFLKLLPEAHFSLEKNFDRADSLANISEMLKYFSGKESEYSSIFMKNTQLFEMKCTTKKQFFPNFGLYKFENSIYSAVLRAGNIGQNGKGGHSHNDQLSLTMKIFGQDFLVDNGTFTYTENPQLRNKFRSTAAHNTLDLGEQNQWKNDSIDDLFWLKKDAAKAKIDQAETNKVLASHRAYLSKTTREIIFGEQEICGTDKVKLPATKYVRFHLAPEVQIEAIADNSCELSLGETRIRFSAAAKITVEDSEYSPVYGRKYPSKAIVVTTNAEQTDWKFTIL